MEDSGRQRIADARNLAEGRSELFSYRDANAFPCEGFVVRFEGKLYAYQNQCRHQPLTLDYGDNEFFADDGKLLLCRNHGAVFQPETGKCIAGPCAGASLRKLEVFEDDGAVFLKLPVEPEFADLE